MRIRPALALIVLGVSALCPAWGQTTPQKIGQLDLTVGGIAATVSPAQPVIPKNIASGVQIVVTQNGQSLNPAAVAQYLGGAFQIEGEFSGPGLTQTIDVPQTSAAPNSLILSLPAVNQAGNYTLSNLRFVVNGNSVLDVSPSTVTVNVIDQVLVTSVQTQPLTADQIQAMGVVLDSSDYTGFQFTVGLQLSSQVVNISFPVVFDQNGVAVPQPLMPPALPPQGISVPLPTIVPLLLQPTDGTQLPNVVLPDGSSAPVRIPSVLVIPGNVGYLKQFFSAQLYVTNGTPSGSNLVVDNVTGTISLPPGADGVVGTSDDPLSLPALTSGPEAATMSILAPGPDGTPSVSTLNPGDTGQAEWTIRGDKEGFYNINFAINATLEGLPTGPVDVTGSAMGGVLVRNPYFNMTFTVPGVVRSGENFNVFATVTNISQAPANDLTVNIDSSSLSGVELTSGAIPPIPTLNPGDSTVLEFQFKSLRTGQVVADYLNFDTQDGTTGSLNFTLGIYGNGTPMSPDTLVLPTSVNNLPSDLVDAAMRVLGQAWSVATAPSGTLPAGVTPITTTVVTQKALSFAEAGLRVTLGETTSNSLRDVAEDFWSGYGGSPVDPGFDQVLHQTPAGQNFVSVLGADLAQPVAQSGGPLPYELQLSQIGASGPNFVAFAAGSGNSSAPVSLTVTDGAGNQLQSASASGTILGGVILPLGASPAPLLGLITDPTTPPYTLLFTGQGSGTLDLSIAIPRGDGTVIRGQTTGAAVVQGQQMRLVADFTNPTNMVLQVDTAGDGSFATSIPLSTQVISPAGPTLVSANVIGPDTVSQAGSFGLNFAVLFDRPVDATTSAIASNYSVPNNSVLAASRQLSGRLVFGNLSQPEGPYQPTTLTLSGVQDERGVNGSGGTVTLGSLLQDPGAVVSGRVFNADGTPSASANVVYSNYGPDPTCMGTELVPVASIPVASDGSYRFRYVRQADCGGGFVMQTKDPNTGALRTVNSYVRAPGQQIVIDFALLGLGSVTGTVSDLSGNPVSDAQVVAISGTDPQEGGQAFTDGSGHYSISGIPVGPFTVTAGLATSLGMSAGNIERAGTATVVNVTLNGGSVQVSGTVTQIQGGVSSPVPGLPVVYYLLEGAQQVPMGYALTAADGSYAIKGMPTGSYTIQAVLSATAMAKATGVAAAGDNLQVPLVIAIQSTGTVNGVVTLPSGSPVGGVLVFSGQNGILSNADGTFSLSGIPIEPSQSQTITARTLDGLRTGYASVVVNAASPPVTTAIVLSGLGSARFTVLDATGKPVTGQTVILTNGSAPCGYSVPTTDSNGNVTFTAASAVTDASGNVTFTNLPVGSVTAKAILQKGSFTDVAQGSANITQDGAAASAILQFGGSGTVTGSVVDPNKNGNPVLGATIQLTSPVYDPAACTIVPGQSQSVQTDTSGNFQFSSVNAGTVAVTASQSFYPTPVGAKGTLTNGGTLNFPLQMVDTTSGVLSGIVYLPDGVTPAGAGVQVTADGPLPDVTVSTDSTGTFKFARIFPEGQYTLTASDPVSGGVTQMHVYLRAGQDMTQNLRLKGTGTVNVTVVDGAGAPVANAFVTLQETDYPNASFDGSLNASNLGVVSFPDVFEGAFSVQVTDSFGRGGRTSAILPQNTSLISVQVQLTTTGTVQGHFYLSDGLTPIPNATVQLIAGGRTIGQATTLSSGDIGSYEFDYVPAGAIQLNGQDPLTGRTGTAAGTISSQNQTLTLNVQAQGLDTVEGIVTSDNAPEPGANVTIVSGTFQATTSTDSTGNYLMSGVPEGSIVAKASLANGFLSGTASAPISGDGNTLTLNVTLRNSGGISGTVVQADGVTPAAASLVTVTVGGTGGGTETTTTDAQGNFAFQLVPSGTATVSAQVIGGVDQGTASVNVPSGSTATVTITLNGTGSISGTALDASGNPIAGTVTLTGTGTFPYSFNLTAGADGKFGLPQVLAGPFTAALQANLGGFPQYGSTQGTVAPGQAATITLQLQPSAPVSGTVFFSDGVTPAPNVNVVLMSTGVGSASTTTDASGHYTFSDVPEGTFRVSVSNTATGDKGQASGQVSAAGTPQTVNVTFDGLGTVTVTVQSATGSAVPNAQVTIQGQTQFAGTQSGTTLPNGTVMFSGVFAGGFSVSAFDPATNLRGFASGTVPANGTASVLLVLQPSGTVTGRVFAPDGATPESGATVTLASVSSSSLTQMISASDGSFQFTSVPLGTYLLESFDATGQERSIAQLTVATGGQTVTQNLVWAGEGVVSGHVYNPDGSVVVGLTVTIRSQSSPATGYIGGTTSAVTDGQGFYQISGVLVGSFTATAEEPALQLSGQASGTISQDGQQVTADIHLVNSAVTLPTVLWDGNNFPFDVNSGGQIDRGYDDVYAGDFSTNQGAFLLDVVSSGTPNRFTGASLASQEISGRQIAIGQSGIAGLNITRKVYVPQDGYFARYLEILSNPTSAPIVVDVRLTANFDVSDCSVLSTSSGDAVLDVSNPQNPDRWVVVGNPGDETPNTTSPPLTAFAFSGAGGSFPVSTATFAGSQSNTGQLVYQWSSVSIPAGGTVAFMHFGVQQTSETSAQASVSRLIMLPPEALVGLTAQEMSEVANFAVPANGSSSVAPLLTSGSITGHLRAGDGLTPVPSTTVNFQSANPIYMRPVTAYTASDGSFTLQSNVTGSGNSTIVPVDSFTLQATDPHTQAQASATGSFAANQTATTQDLVFTGTGVIQGTVTYYTGDVATGGGTASAASSDGTINSYASIHLDGTYTITGLPPASYTVTANSLVPGYNPFGASLSGTAAASVAAGQNVTTNISLEPTGTVTGAVFTAGGSPVPSVLVELNSSNPTSGSFAAYTDANGQYTLTQVPAGPATAQVTDPNTGATTTASLTVTEGQTTALNLTLAGFGTVQVQVNLATGSPAVNSLVQIEMPGQTYFRTEGYTNASGQLTISNVLVGSFEVQAYAPGSSQISSTVSGTMPGNGDVVPVVVTLPGTGTISGRLTYARGTGVASVNVVLTGPNISYQYATTDSNGNFSFGTFTSGTAFTVAAAYPGVYYISASASGTVGANGTSTNTALVFPAVATVTVAVKRYDGTPFANAFVVLSFGSPTSSFGVNADSNGNASFSHVPQGGFTVQVQDPYTGQVAGMGSGTVNSTDDGGTVSTTVTTGFSANIQGNVYAADGQTPVPSAYVQVQDAVTNQVLFSTYTDTNGFYQMLDISPSSQSFVVIAQSPSDSTVTVSQSGSFATFNQTVTINLTLPVSVVNGTIMFSDGTAVPYPNVLITQTDSLGNQQTYYPVQTDGSGNYSFVGIPVGAFTVQAQDYSSGLNGSATSAVASIATPVTVAVTLQPSGTVIGVVYDSTGAPVPYAPVLVSSSGLSFNRSTNADSNGNYEVDYVATGTIVVSAGPNSYPLVYEGASSGNLTSSGQQLTLNVNLQSLSTIDGTVFGPDGVTPVPGATVSVENSGIGGGLADYFYTGPGGELGRTTSDSSGAFQVTQVPTGQVSILATSPDGSSSGYVSGNLTASSALTLNPILGNAANLQNRTYNLTDANGFLYDIDCAGEVVSGGLLASGIPSYSYGSSVLVDGNSGPLCTGNDGLLDQGGSEVAFGPRPGGATNALLEIGRKVFVPPAGGFARYLEVLTNPLNTSVTTTVQIHTNLAYTPDTLAVDPGSNGQTFGVESDSTSVNPTVGFAFDGPGSSVQATSSFTAGTPQLSYAWTVTIPAHQTVILMHFLVQRNGGDTAGASSQAQALVGLTDPNALVGMSDQEKSEVVNFNVP